MAKYQWQRVTDGASVFYIKKGPNGKTRYTSNELFYKRNQTTKKSKEKGRTMSKNRNVAFWSACDIISKGVSVQDVISLGRKYGQQLTSAETADYAELAETITKAELIEFLKTVKVSE